MSPPAPDTGRLRSALAEGFNELAKRIEFEVERRCGETTEQFNRAARRLSAAGTEEDWAAALLDAAAGFAPRAALFAVRGEVVRLLGARGASAASLEVPVSEGAAFASAVHSRDTVVALRDPGEVSAAVTRLFGDEPGGRCVIVPLMTRERVSALLYAEGVGVDVNALEALAALAGPVRRAAVAPDEQGAHLRAQHFARVRVAEMRLYRSRAVRAGRDDKALYRELKDEIESAREAYRREFLPAASNMVDYLHLELVRALANEDAVLLGEDYPGPLA